MPGKKAAPAEAPGLNPPEVAERRKYRNLRKSAPSLFLTLSAADLHWDDLMCHLPNYPEWLAGDAATRRRIARNSLQNNPHIIAQWFDIRFRLFQDKVLKRLFSVSDSWSRLGQVQFQWPRAHVPFSGAKIQQTKRAKQARKTGLPEDGALQWFTSGTWVVLKPSGFSPSEDFFLAVVNGVSDALRALLSPDLSGPKHIEIRKKKLWIVELYSIDTARRLAGRTVTIKDQEGKERVVRAESYYTAGPSQFVIDRTDTIISEEIARKISAMIPRTFFVVDEMRVGNTTGPKKWIVFAEPPGFSKMEIGFGDYKIKFWPEDLNGVCHFCRTTVELVCSAGRRFYLGPRVLLPVSSVCYYEVMT
ncbi:hypothetical protein N7465_011863 [Penicillium sp. CMV-2018d]|nr:hypothetical protein N7465_011863 [Penicillium sp. CMV-2018d]